jgi:hypothetical protein
MSEADTGLPGAGAADPANPVTPDMDHESEPGSSQ